jgi:hypothetical protein
LATIPTGTDLKTVSTTFDSVISAKTPISGFQVMGGSTNNVGFSFTS